MNFENVKNPYILQGVSEAVIKVSLFSERQEMFVEIVVISILLIVLFIFYTLYNLRCEKEKYPELFWPGTSRVVRVAKTNISYSSSH